jgi:hypothetical protein
LDVLAGTLIFKKKFFQVAKELVLSGLGWGWGGGVSGSAAHLISCDLGLFIFQISSLGVMDWSPRTGAVGQSVPLLAEQVAFAPQSTFSLSKLISFGLTGASI